MGPAVGYMWNGKWCLRSRPAIVRNPRTPRQMECRALFAEQVRLAAAMRRGVLRGMTVAAREMGMTAYNLFVSVNQEAFSSEEGRLRVDWQRLTLSVGDVAPVEFGRAAVDEHGVLSVRVNGHTVSSGRRSPFDEVRLYVYCPDEGAGVLSSTVARYDKKISILLPTFFLGKEVVVYGFVEDSEGVCSLSVYIPLEDSAVEAPEPVAVTAVGKKDSALCGEMCKFAGSDGAGAVSEEADLQGYG